MGYQSTKSQKTQICCKNVLRRKCTWVEDEIFVHDHVVHWARRMPENTSFWYFVGQITHVLQRFRKWGRRSKTDPVRRCTSPASTVVERFGISYGIRQPSKPTKPMIKSANPASWLISQVLLKSPPLLVNLDLAFKSCSFLASTLFAGWIAIRVGKAPFVVFERPQRNPITFGLSVKSNFSRQLAKSFPKHRCFNVFFCVKLCQTISRYPISDMELSTIASESSSVGYIYIQSYSDWYYIYTVLSIWLYIYNPSNGVL